MWYKSETGNTEKPSEIDTESSRVYVYLRKDFEKKIREPIQEGEEPTKYWEYMEQKIKKEDWETYQRLTSNENDLTDAQVAIVGLYEMLTGGEK